MQQLFGTDGIRAPVGKSPITPAGIIQIGHAIAQWVLATYGLNAQIIIGHDTRASCTDINNLLTTTLLLYAFEIQYVGVIPTAGLSMLLRKNNAHCAIMITASHNPYYENGIKIITAYGKLASHDELIISDYYFNHKFKKKVFNRGKLTIESFALQKIINFIMGHRLAINLSNLKVVVDCANGSVSGIAATILQQCNIEVISTNDRPNGININAHCGSLFPQKLQKIVQETKADIGFAFDGDGDRIIAVTQSGIVKDGDDILAFLATHPNYTNEQTLIGTIMSNEGLAEHLLAQQKKLIRTEVGDRAVSDYLYKNNLHLGAEPSGHILLTDLLPCGDGLLSMIKILETVASTHNKNMDTFIKWPHVLIGIPIMEKKDLATHEFQTIIDYHKKKLSAGRILVRYSGTEPLLRIMIESPVPVPLTSIAKDLAEHLAQALLRE